MDKKLQLLWVLLLILLSLFSCTTEEESEYAGMSGKIDFLPPLNLAWEYQAWLIENNNTRRMGTVNPNEEGTAFLAFGPLPDQIRDGRTVFITIEEAGSNEINPSVRKVMEGNFFGAEIADLDFSPVADFDGITGTCILDSPTVSGMSTDNSGIWFMNESGEQGLSLPSLPADWVYEGWVNFDGIWVSTGAFSSPAMSDFGNPYSGNLLAYSFPGEDFNNDEQAPEGVSFPQDLAGKEVVIALEPNFDSDPAFFGLSLLKTLVPSPSITKTNIEMNPLKDQLPQGIIRKVK